jgi:filamentous hemagglutinin
VVSGRQAIVDVGGNLNIESLQDLSTYDSKQQSMGGSLSVGYGRMSGSVSLSKSTVNSNFASVTEQSGIKAGDDGFDVNVKGATDLKGAVIASTDKAVAEGKNSFATGSLTMSDIENKAEYEAKGVGVTLGMSANAAKTTPQGTSAGFGHDSGNAASTTKSGVSGIAGNQDVRTDDAETGIQKIFDADKVQKEVDAQMLITQKFGEQASKAVGDYADKQMKEALAKRNQAAALPADDPQIATLLADAQSLEDQWGANGIARLGAHTLIGGLTGGVGGAAGAAAGTLTAPAVAKALADAGVSSPLANTLTELASTAAGAVAGGATGSNAGALAGAGAALNEAANNYLKHDEAMRLADLKNKKLMGQCETSCEKEIADLEQLDKERNIELAACQGVDNPGCNSARQEVRTAAAEYIRKGSWASDLLSVGVVAGERDETLGYAKETLNGKALGMAQGAGGAALDAAAGTATLVNALLGFSSAQEAVVKGTGAAWEYVQNPDNWPYLLGAMTPGQRAHLAQAYEQGDGNAVGRIMGEQVFNILTSVDTGGMASGIKLVKAGEKVEDAAKVGKYAPVGNMGNFLKSEGFGNELSGVVQKTSKIYDGQSVYEAQEKLGEYIKKNDQIYLDPMHKDHIEVFDKNGNFRWVLNLDGTPNPAKTDAAQGRRLSK